jgi:hypothetical protein
MAFGNISRPTASTGGDRTNGSQFETYGRSRRRFLATLATFGIDAVAGSGRSNAQTPPRGTKPGLIDVHHHIMPPAYLAGAREYLMSAWRVAGRQQSLPATLRDWSPQKSVAEMDKNGVATSIVSFPSAVISPGDAQSARTLARKINEYGAQLVRDYPGRFGLFATVPRSPAGLLRRVTSDRVLAFCDHNRGIGHPTSGSPTPPWEQTLPVPAITSSANRADIMNPKITSRLLNVGLFSRGRCVDIREHPALQSR